jgi:hypothetical protein
LPFRVHNLKVETFSSDDFIPTAMKFWQDELEELEGAKLEINYWSLYLTIRCSS